MAVITISKQFGSGGDEIANRLCEALGYKSFNKKMIVESAKEAGISENEVMDYSEENYKVRSFLDRLFGSMATVETLGYWITDTGRIAGQDEFIWDQENALELEKKAVISAYHNGNMVILGRGGQMILKDLPGVFHVRIEAPMEDRIQRVKEEIRQNEQKFDADIETRRQAQDLINRKDQASAEYIKTYYQAAWNDAQHYHLVINTGRVSIEQAVQLITYLVREVQEEKP